jgi:SAM-dependent methyltransferase
MPEMTYRDDPEKLRAKVLRLAQFPKGRRKQSYQSYWLGDEYIAGSRDVLYRLEKLGLPKTLLESSVLDLGCNLGTVCVECYNRGSREILGIDNDKDYVECARDLARYNGHQINFIQSDLKDSDKIVKYIKSYFSKPVDHVFALAMYKHIGNSLWDILDGINFRTVYLESSGCKDITTPHVVEVDKQLKERYEVEFLGFTEDRSKRAIWRATSGG